MEKKLEVKDLIISFRTSGGKVQAVRNISFDLYKGETLAIVGESGSGKSVTNRAIIGILAGNSIVEGGEIIYDGQDLLKISEDEFHKIRGDKIAMIFQDPMSSLNPIMKVGTQLTEAMLLKSSSGRRNARRNFNSKLKLLNKFMDLGDGDNKAEIENNKQECQLFDKFCINSTKLESAYNEIHRAVIELQMDVENQLFLQSKKQPIEVKKVVKGFIKRIPTTYHPDLVVADQAMQEVLNALGNETKLPASKRFSDECVNALKQLAEILDKASKRQKPNYFTLGFYMMKNPNANVDDMPIDELTEMTQKYLDEEFLNSFIADGSKAMLFSHQRSIQAKKALLAQTDEFLNYFHNEVLDKKEALALSKNMIKLVNDAIDNLQVAKNSVEHTFASSIKDALNKYFAGVVKNPKEQARYDRQKAKHDELIAKGKNVDWKVVPPALVDLDLARKNIRAVIHNLRASYRNDIENDANYNGTEQMKLLIEYLKEQASAVVYKVTRKMAKAKALKLLEEVGIPEPAIRYNQYPFEFSGGMRQRIVIAIALAANPDILICDEPTTALDVTIQSQILELINRIKAERNLSVIFITHDLGVVANMADRIAVMYAGKIVEYGTADDVFYDPRHPYTWALLSSMPDLDTTEKLEAIPGTPPNMIFPPKGDAFAARNKYALEIDFEQEPPMFQISDTHYAATWLLHPSAPEIAPPKIVVDRIERMSKKGVQ
ncbi:MAG: ATP-binding cassette domain-containing protein [Clostridia bacterium]|nr:ATP-binding cassette domain-containing protein [Clostridia bacterium]MBR2985821.1 ATP-binding cassette domain-containing protein [Clostridia bacterium]